MTGDIKEQYDKIYKYCYFKVHNRELAEDLTQETFLRYFNQTSYLATGKQLAYLYTIAKNLCMDYFRSSKKTPCTSNEDITTFPAAADPSLEGMADTLALTQAVAKLPQELQELILLRYVENLSVSTTAKILEISRFVLYRREKEAMAQLRKQLL